MNLPALRLSLARASASYSPQEVQDIICSLFTGKNYRRLTEKPTRQTISVFAAWILNIAHKAVLSFGKSWNGNLLELLSRKGTSREEKWLRVWLLGLTQKTAVNLEIRAFEYQDYQERALSSTDDVVRNLQWQPDIIALSSKDLGNVPLSARDSIWLIQIAGAAALTIRGSKKSSAGKILEKAIARAALSILGLKEGDTFWLNVARDEEVEREVDAEILTRRGRIRVDIALIGTGNQEVSEDKLARVGPNGVVLVDKLGPKSQVPKNAARHQVKIIQLRNNFPLTELFAYIQPLVPDGVSLRKPPTNDKRLEALIRTLPPTAFSLPVAE